ncbi:hypothetical protein K439DRAFT_1637329 [Ramaria rubella]|nr:hypothetical protein K439DRAFT_1637329 [Ramaria rubella]
MWGACAVSPVKAKEVGFSPALSVAAREKDNQPKRSASPAPSSVPSLAACAKYNGATSPAKASPMASLPYARHCLQQHLSFQYAITMWARAQTENVTPGNV